ncbi:MAG: hypothetical protein RQM92_09260 [Candidatus Syntrophopropionicum ammoniitolerans]
MQKEARLIAARIKELVGLSAEQDALHIYDRGLKQYRPLTYRDVVVLLRATSGHANTFVEEFRLFDIPVYAELATGYFQATEIETILSLLKIIDNPTGCAPGSCAALTPGGAGRRRISQDQAAFTPGQLFSCSSRCRKGRRR